MALSVKGGFRIATAFRAGLRHYDAGTFKADLTAGLIVSLVALPLSMALSIAVGLPPQHGLYTAIVAGIVAALLGGSMTQVSGPTAAFVVIIAPIVSNLGLNGLVWCQIMAGAIMVVLGVARLGKLINYVPYAVTTGFTAGIAIVIATLSLNDFFGLHIAQLTGDYLHKASTLAAHLPQTSLPELAVGIVSLLTIIFFGKVTHKIPSPIVGMTLGALLGWVLNHYGYSVDTLGSRFSYETAQGTQHGIPPYPPSFHALSLPDMAHLKQLIGPAFMIAALAALESLLSATVADGMAHTKHDPNAELNGIGIANIACGFVGGIPATGAIARTAANIHAGAKTPVASAIHALFILLYILTLAPLINYVPMAALAALLLTVAWRMSHVHQFIHLIRKAPVRTDVIVLLGCFIPTVLIDMVAGVSTGLALAIFFHLLHKTKTPHSDIGKMVRDEQQTIKDIEK